MKDFAEASQAHSALRSSANLKQRAVRGWLVTMANQGGKLVLHTASTVVLARLLTPADYGIVAMVAGALAFLTSFKDLGLSMATIQREKITTEEVSGLFWINVAVSLVFAVIIAACAPLIAWFYGRPELIWITWAYAAMAPLSGLAAQHQALLQRSMRYGSLAVRDLTALIAGVAAGIASAVAGLGYWSLIIMRAVSELVGLVALWWQSGWRPSAPRWTPNLKPLLKFGGTLTVSNLLGYVMNGLDNVILGYCFGPAPLGIYNRAQGLMKQPLQQFMPPLMSVATSTFARLGNDPAKFERSAFQLLGMLASVTGLIVVVMMGTASWLVAILLGSQWMEAVPIFSVLALFAFIQPCASLLGTLLVVSGRPHMHVRWQLFSAPIVVLGLVAGLPWGVLGVAICFSLSGLLIRAPLFFIFTARTMGWSVARLFQPVAAPIVSGFLTVWVLALGRGFWSPTHPVVGVAVFGAAAALFYLGLLSISAHARGNFRATLQLLRSARSQSDKAPPADGMRE